RAVVRFHPGPLSRRKPLRVWRLARRRDVADDLRRVAPLALLFPAELLELRLLGLATLRLAHRCLGCAAPLELRIVDRAGARQLVRVDRVFAHAALLPVEAASEPPTLCPEPRGRGGTGRRAGFRSRWASALGGSIPLARMILEPRRPWRGLADA